MIINGDQRLSEQLLQNWGRWCSGEIRLGYAEPPTSKGYTAPSNPRPPSYPISVTDAKVANAAILHIALKEFPRDNKPPTMYSVYDFIKQKWAQKTPRISRSLASYYKVSPRTIQRRADGARDLFINEYFLIVRDAYNLSKKVV